MTSHRRTNRTIPNIAGSIASHPRHSSQYRISHVVRTVLVSILLAALTFVGTAAAAVWVDINSTIEQRSFTLPVQADDANKDNEPQLVDVNAGKPVNVLLLGQDTREGDGNAAVGGSDDSTANLHNADTTIVAQIAADRSYINLVSIPRDSMVDVPSCSTANGTIPAQYYVQFNSIFANAYSYGGDLASAAGCTVNAVNALTGLDIQEVVVVDFQGLSSMIDALGGVDICIQQYLIKALLNEALSKNLFTNSPQLYQLARAALESLNISDGLADAATLAGLAMSLKNLDSSHLYAQTVPVVADPYNPTARVVWSDAADAVWEKLRTNQPLTAQSDDGQSADGTADDSSGTASDTPSDTSANADSSQQTTQDGTDTDTGTEQTQQAAPDPNTGLVTSVDPYTLQEVLTDPATGGVVDPETGSITAWPTSTSCTPSAGSHDTVMCCSCAGLPADTLKYPSTV